MLNYNPWHFSIPGQASFRFWQANFFPFYEMVLRIRSITSPSPLSRNFCSKKGITARSCRAIPFCFVYGLGHLIMKEVELGHWKPISLGRGGPAISHLFFADDIFLFGRANPKQAEIIRNTLDQFCSASGALELSCKAKGPKEMRRKSKDTKWVSR